MDVQTSEIKLQLNNAAGGRLYFTRLHIPETETTWNSFSVRTSWNWNKTKLSTVGWNEAPIVDSFVLFQLYFTMCDGLKMISFCSIIMA